MSRVRNSSRVVVAGGGVIGLSVAWELSERGHRVTVIERDQLGKATSWAASGILPPANLETATDPLDRLRGLSHQLFPQWHERLLDQTGIDSGLRRCGGWYLATTPGEYASMLGMRDYWDELRIECEACSSEEVRAREPVLDVEKLLPRDVAGWWLPDEYQIRSPRLLQALGMAMKGRGVEVLEGKSVDSLDGSGASVRVGCGSDIIEADAIVVCGGAWTGRFSARLGLERSVVPIRGQILALRTQGQPLHSVINVGNRYLVPREDGLTLVGSNEEEVGFTLGTTDATLNELYRFACTICPHLRSSTVEAKWSGLRPMTFDGFPMIGRVPETKNVYVAAGHYRSGIHFSCGTAVILADLMEGKEPTIDVTPFRVGKQQQFSIR